jgi:hypothetical protein
MILKVLSYARKVLNRMYPHARQIEADYVKANSF